VCERGCAPAARRARARAWRERAAAARRARLQHRDAPSRRCAPRAWPAPQRALRRVAARGPTRAPARAGREFHALAWVVSRASRAIARTLAQIADPTAAAVVVPDVPGLGAERMREVFALALDCAYSGGLEVPAEDALDLWALAASLQMPGVQARCEAAAPAALAGEGSLDRALLYARGHAEAGACPGRKPYLDPNCFFRGGSGGAPRHASDPWGGAQARRCAARARRTCWSAWRHCARAAAWPRCWPRTARRCWPARPPRCARGWPRCGR